MITHLVIYLISNLVGTILFFFYRKYLTLGDLICCSLVGWLYGILTIIEFSLEMKCPDFDRVIIGKKK